MVCFAKPLEMHDLPFPQELDRVAHVRVVDQAQQVVIRRACLLLRSKVLKQIGDRVAGRLEGRRAERRARRGLRVNARRVVDKIAFKAARPNIVRGHVARQLVEDRRDNFFVRKLLGAQRSIGNVPLPRNARTAAIYGL